MMLKLLGALALLASVSDVCLGEAGSACYGTDPTCDYYSLQCPSSQIIRLYNLYAGYKSEPVCGTSSNNHCSYSSTCCSYKSGDIYELFKLENIYSTYTNCSGKQICQNVQAPWQLLDYFRPNAVTSTYVQIEYGCEPVSSKIPLCGGATGSFTGVYNTAEIMFDGSVENFDPAKASKECKCTVENIGIQQYVVVTAVDVRLQSYFKKENQSSAACSSATLTVSSLYTLQCAETSHHYNVNFYYNDQKTLRISPNSSSEIVLSNIHKNGTYDSPAVVWISLQAEVNKTIRVTCEEVIPAQFTTTTTTTPTSTTTPTTTTTTPTTTSATTTTSTTTKTTPSTITTTPTTITTTPSTTTTTPTTTTATTTTTTPTTTTPSTTTPTTSTTTTPSTTKTTPTTTTTTSTTTTTTTTTPTTTTSTSSVTTTTTATTTATTKTTATTSTPTTTTPTTTSTTSTSTSTTPTTTTTSVRPTTTTLSTTTLPTTTTTTTSTTAPILPTTLTRNPTTNALITSPTSTSTVSPAVPPVDTTVKHTSTNAAQMPVGESDKNKNTSVVLAIIIPIVIGAFIILFVILWVYWRRTSPKRKKFNFMNGKPKHKVYQTFRDSKILDQFIDEMGIDPYSPVVLGQEKLPLTQLITVPNPKPPSIRRSVTEFNPKQSYISNGSVKKSVPHIQPYVIQLPTGNGSNYSPRTPASPVHNVVHVRMGFGGDQKAPTAAAKEIKPGQTKQLNNNQKASPKVGANLKAKGKPLEGDGSVLIHVDNLSLPPVSPKPSSVNTSSTRSEMGSTPRELTPERRNSEPALIDTEPYLQRNSASAYVLPGTSPEDSSVLFVTNM